MVTHKCKLNLSTVYYIIFCIFPVFHKFFFKFMYLFIWLCWVFVVERGLFFSCGERGLLLVAVRGLLIAVDSLVAEHGL